MDYKVKYDGRGDFPDEIVANIQKNRGIDDKFLRPTAKDLLPLDALKNVDKAYDLLMDAINTGTSVAILADTDADGITSGTIMYRYIKKITPIEADVEPYICINHGKKHGLCKDEDYFEGLKNYRLLIVVDSLNSGIDEYKELVNSGVKIIVLDHHNINPEVPYDDYVTLVSSQRDYDNPQLSGAGVVWKFCKYCDMRNKTYDADEFVDLAAIGIAADVMDMTVMENRYIVYEGLQRLNNPAVKKIVGSYEFNSRGILFSVAPLINAANRMDQNDVALEALLEISDKSLRKEMRVFKKCKTDQDDKVTKAIESMQNEVEDQINDDAKFLFVGAEDISGLSGLIATKLASRYDRPVFVVSDCGGEYKGSLRCNNSFNLAEAVNNSGLAIASGHEGAAGFSIKAENVVAFEEYMNKALENQTADMAIEVDVQLDADDFSMALAHRIHDIDYVSGKNFQPITFLVDGVEDYEVGTFKDGKHLVLNCGSHLTIVKWNSPYDIDEFNDGAMFHTPLRASGTIQIGGFGANRKTWLIADEIELME